MIPVVMLIGAALGHLVAGLTGAAVGVLSGCGGVGRPVVGHFGGNVR